MKLFEERFTFWVQRVNISHLIERFERFPAFLVFVGPFHFFPHHGQEFWEINGSVFCGGESHIEMGCSMVVTYAKQL